MAIARHSTVSLTYNGITATQMEEYIVSFKYTDVSSGSSDNITVELSDKDRRWINSWFPQKGDKLKPTLIKHRWDQDDQSYSLSCGTFVIDDFSFKGNPIQCTIEAAAIPSTSGFKVTERTYTYENTTLKNIGLAIAKRNGLSLHYEAKTVSIENVVQDKKSDCAFYNDLIVKYGLALKIYNDRLVVFDEAIYEAKPVVATLTESDFEPGWSWNTSLAGTYTGVRYSYTHAQKNKTFTVNVGSGSRILTCDDEASNLTEATLIALAKVNNANKNTTTMKITLRTPARTILATNCVKIQGLGKLDGKYYVESVTLSIGSSGTKSTLNLRKVENRLTVVPAKSKTSSSTKAATTTTSTNVKASSSTAEKKKQTVVFKKGDKVRVTKGAKTYPGGSLASFVYTTIYDVIQVGGKDLPDDRIVIGQGRIVVAAVKAADLYKA